MSLLVSVNEISAFLEMSKTDTWLSFLWETMQLRASDHVSVSGIVQPGDTQEWWYLAEQRINDVAFTYHVTRRENFGKWLHDVILWICERSAGEWVGPWFRPIKDPPVGQLETSHICAAVSTTLDLAEDVFSSEEKQNIKNELRKKGMEACERFLDETKHSAKNNWSAVVLDGYASVAAVLDDRAALARVKEEYRELEKLFNADSYGETIQYWTYAAVKMSHTWETLFRVSPDLVSDLSLPYIRCVPWYVSSFMYMQSLGGEAGEKLWPRVINYGDSALTNRIPGDLALHIAHRSGEKFQREAGLARWIFEHTYENAEIRANERAAFGFINNFGFYTLLHYPFAAPRLDPAAARLPLVSSYQVGHIIIRDSFKSPKTIISTFGGYQPLGTAAHRHQDLNSFTLSHLDEIFFADPGHCCYRTRTHRFTSSGESHSAWRFQTEDGKWIDQTLVGKDNFGKPLSSLKFLKTAGSITVTASDAAKAYSGVIKKAERLMISVLPHGLFIVDTIEAEKPVKVQSNFAINNRDNKLKYNIAAPTKLVLRRNLAALKFFQSFSEPVSNFSFSWTCIHDYYHPLPNQPGQGKEGSGMIFTQTSSDFCQHYHAVYVIAMAEEAAIRGWHIFAGGKGIYEIEAPGGDYRIRLEMKQDEISVTNGETGETFVYCV